MQGCGLVGRHIHPEIFWPHPLRRQCLNHTSMPPSCAHIVHIQVQTTLYVVTHGYIEHGDVTYLFDNQHTLLPIRTSQSGGSVWFYAICCASIYFRSGRVQTSPDGFAEIWCPLNFGPDYRSSSHQQSNLRPDFSQVCIGSGSKLSSGPDAGSTSSLRLSSKGHSGLISALVEVIHIDYSSASITYPI